MKAKADFTYNKTEARINELRAKPGGVAGLSDADYQEFKRLASDNAKARGL